MKSNTLFAAALLAFGITQAQADPIYVPYSFTNFVGGAGGLAFSDGQGAGARFRGADGVSVDNAGNVFVGDANNFAVRKISPSGYVTTIASGLGSLSGVAADNFGNVYVANASYMIQKIDPSGNVTVIAGTAGSPGTADGTGSAARFSGPAGMACDSAGNVYVADGYAIRQITPGGVVTTIAGSVSTSGSIDGTKSAARFGSSLGTPHGVAVDAYTNIYVADFGNSTIRKVTPTGANWTVSTIAGVAGSYGYTDGIGSAARFSYIGPSGVAVDRSGNIYVTDSGNTTVRKIIFDGTNWVVSTLAGAVGQQGTADGNGNNARFTFLKGASCDPAGNLFVSDFQSGTIRKITPGADVTTFAGSPPQVGSTDATGSAALFDLPYNVAVDNWGTVYIADTFNHTIRRATTDGVVTTLVGKARSHGSVDGTNTVARLYEPHGLCVDANTNIYFVERSNDEVRKAYPVANGWAVVTLAGLAQTAGTNDGSYTNARFTSPVGIAMSSAGDLYVADSGNHAVRKMTLSGTNWTVSTFAGNPATPGYIDGTGTGAQFNAPQSIAIDRNDNLYVSDGYRIREITPDAVVTSLVGCIGAGCTDPLDDIDGTGSAIRPGYPIGLAVDAAGNIYVGDINFHLVRRLSFYNGDWMMVTLGGKPGQSSVVGGIAGTSRFDYPDSLAVDSAGNLYVANTLENCISKGVPAVTFDTSDGASVSNGAFNIRLTTTANSNVVVEASTDLTNWSPVKTNAISPGGQNLSLPLSGYKTYYRAHAVP